MSAGQARPDRLALKPYWGKPAVRNFREGDGNVGIIRSPVRAIALPDLDGNPPDPTRPRVGHGTKSLAKVTLGKGTSGR
jgi:hypothetical protein